MMIQPTTAPPSKYQFVRRMLEAIEQALACYTGQPEVARIFAWFLANRIEKYDGKLANQLRQLLAPAQQPPALVYPAEITPELEKILTLMPWQCGQIAQLYRAAGHPIESKAEAEQCFVMDRAIKLALRHGADWYSVLRDEMSHVLVLAHEREEVKA